MRERESLAESHARYVASAHAMQSGVKFLSELGAVDDQSPKHLRVGINYAMVTQCAIAKLLIARGIFTEEEYATQIADEMEREVVRYQKLIEAKIGKPVTLL